LNLLLDPTPDLPDDTAIERIRWPTRILTVLRNAGIKTVGEIRETSDADILRFQRGGPGVIAFLRRALGRPT
jgi:DNA-directed RNA polymerase alpha subunit